MTQAASTSHADDVPGATAVRVLGALLILQGGFRVYTQINTVVLVVQREIYAPSLFLTMFLSGVMGFLAIAAGVLLVRLDRAARGFGLVVCSIALAHQVFAFASTLVAFKAFSFSFSTSTALSLGLLFWLLPLTYMVLFLVGIILIARWHPPRLPG
jgi:hypothetical protein